MDISISLYLKEHPLLGETQEFKDSYLSALKYFADMFSDNNFSQVIFSCYIKAFSGNSKPGSINNKIPSSVTENRIRWRKLFYSLRKGAIFNQSYLFSYRFVFAADCFFICAFNDENKAQKVLSSLKELYKSKYHRDLTVLFEVLYHSASLTKDMWLIRRIVRRWRENVAFLSQVPERILVTATMSAGKSTMINAIIGDTLAKTSQEACTAELHRYYNKPFDDRFINNEDNKTLVFIDKQVIGQNRLSNLISDYYHTFFPIKKPICLIDSPGVNSAINQSHKRVTQKALKEANYDKLIYLFHAAGGLGREEDALYLKYISQVVPKNKTIFVVNKLDAFRKSEDSISESLDGVRKDLENLGYENPLICPLSAYFGFLIKKKLKGEELDEDEQDEFDRYVRKFKKPEYDLSSYYPPHEDHRNDILTEMSIRCGLYGLEKILAGA